METILAYLLLAAGFYLLLKGADLLVKGASSLAKLINVPEIVIGLTIVAFGTSMPEFIVNVFSSIGGHSEIVFGNIIGSNIFNVLLILGVAGLIYPISMGKDGLWPDFLFSLAAPLLFFVLANDSLFFGRAENILSRLDGILLLALFLLFMHYTVRLAKSAKKQNMDGISSYTMPATIFYIVIGLGALIYGGKLVVDSSVLIVRSLGVSEKLIALTIIAGGTSLPELATSAVAACKKRFAIALGNIIGSNVFNILFILGISAIIRPAAYAAILNIDTYIMACSIILLFGIFFMHKAQKLNRAEAFLLLLGYAAYLYYLIGRG